MLAGGGLEDDDIATIGGLIGEPLTVVESTLGEGLIVPALAEIVLEGTIRHDRVAVEGVGQSPSLVQAAAGSSVLVCFVPMMRLTLS